MEESFITMFKRDRHYTLFWASWIVSTSYAPVLHVNPKLNCVLLLHYMTELQTIWETPKINLLKPSSFFTYRQV